MTPFPQAAGPIGVFDSGYGGLTILHGIRQLLPHHDFIYLGDNARAPYGPRSFEVVYEFTRQAVRHLFAEGCHLVILGCNTASAKALRSIQQNDLPQWDAHRRVLGIIRPTAEIVGGLTRSRHVGILATEGTIRSHSYAMEIAKLWPNIKVSGQACPFWVPLVEYNEADSPGADYFVKKRLDQLHAEGSAHRHPHPGLHPLSYTAAQDCEIRQSRRAHRAAGRICSLQPEGLSAAPSRHGHARCTRAVRWPTTPQRIPTASRRAPASSSAMK